MVDLLGAIAYGELSAFERLAEDAKLAPTLEDKVALAAMASAEFGHFAPAAGPARASSAPTPSRRWRRSKPIDEFHEHTAPSDWLEGLVKAYVGDGLAGDFYREIAALLDADTRDLILEALDATGHSRVRRRPGARAPSRTTTGSAAGWRCGAAG